MIVNKKALRNYFVKESFEAGVVLKGNEVKSIRDNRVDLKDSYVKMVNGELWLINANISLYKNSYDPLYDSYRSRKLLVKRSELISLGMKNRQSGLVYVPLKIYFRNGRVKLLVGLGRGRKQHEKKDIQKERDLELELHREKRKYMIE